MRTTLIAILAIAALLALGLLGAGRLGLLHGTRPDDLGVRQGRLRAPSLTANSVSSQAALHVDHPMRDQAGIAPLPMHGDARASIAALRALVESMPRVTIVEERDDYLRAEFATPMLRFVDDVEFWADARAGTIHVRSASRIGRKDFGANRQRVETIRERWSSNLPPRR